MATRLTLTLDCARPRELARFWCGALGYEPAPPPTGFESWEEWLRHHDVPPEEWDDGAAIHDPAGVGPPIGFLEVPEQRAGKNRMHLDLQVSGGRHLPGDERTERIRAEIGRLAGLGARVVAEFPSSGAPHVDHVWMADPEGNDFCVV